MYNTNHVEKTYKDLYCIALEPHSEDYENNTERSEYDLLADALRYIIQRAQINKNTRFVIGINIRFHDQLSADDLRSLSSVLKEIHSKNMQNRIFVVFSGVLKSSYEAADIIGTQAISDHVIDELPASSNIMFGYLNYYEKKIEVHLLERHTLTIPLYYMPVMQPDGKHKNYFSLPLSMFFLGEVMDMELFKKFRNNDYPFDAFNITDRLDTKTANEIKDKLFQKTGAKNYSELKEKHYFYFFSDQDISAFNYHFFNLNDYLNIDSESRKMKRLFQKNNNAQVEYFFITPSIKSREEKEETNNKVMLPGSLNVVHSRFKEYANEIMISITALVNLKKNEYINIHFSWVDLVFILFSIRLCVGVIFLICKLLPKREDRKADKFKILIKKNILILIIIILFVFLLLLFTYIIFHIWLKFIALKCMILFIVCILIGFFIIFELKFMLSITLTKN